MKTSAYPYGKVTKTLKNAVSWLNKNKRRLERTETYDSFDCPDYWGMPGRISCRLNSDEVDWLQEQLGNWKLLEPDIQ